MRLSALFPWTIQRLGIFILVFGALIQQACTVPHGVHVRQTPLSLLKLPDCALRCFVNHVVADNCAVITDFACHCGDESLFDSYSSCIAQRCDQYQRCHQSQRYNTCGCQPKDRNQKCHQHWHKSTFQYDNKRSRACTVERIEEQHFDNEHFQPTIERGSPDDNCIHHNNRDLTCHAITCSTHVDGDRGTNLAYCPINGALPRSKSRYRCQRRRSRFRRHRRPRLVHLPSEAPAARRTGSHYRPDRPHGPPRRSRASSTTTHGAHAPVRSKLA